MEGKVEGVAKELNDDKLKQVQQEGETQEIQLQCDDNITEEEKNKIRLMRLLLEKQDPSSKEADDYALRRFLRARDLDVDKASAMFLKYLKWKRSFVPNGSISASEIPNEIAHNKMFMQGVDKQGRPIAVVFGGRHFPNKIGGLDEFKRFVVLALDKLCSRTSPGSREKFVVIADLQGFGYSNSDARAYIGALSILQDCYPERLGKLIVVHVPYLFWTLWKIIYPFIDNTTKKKIVFLENKRLTTTLLQDMDESQLPEIYGGCICLCKQVTTHYYSSSFSRSINLIELVMLAMRNFLVSPSKKSSYCSFTICMISQSFSLNRILKYCPLIATSASI